MCSTVDPHYIEIRKPFKACVLTLAHHVGEIKPATHYNLFRRILIGCPLDFCDLSEKSQSKYLVN